MKTYSCHDKHYKVILFQAAVITLLLHLAMLYSFVYEPPVQKLEQSTARKIVMFNAVDSNSKQTLAMARWLEYHNPGLIAQPNYINGYGAVSQRLKVRPVINDSIPITPQPPAIAPPRKFEPLMSRNKMKFDDNSRFVGYQTLALRPLHAVERPPPPHNYPLFKLPNGKYIDGILTIEELNYHNLSTTKTTANTILQAVVPAADMMPRITIKQSCGIAKLDMLAVRKLLLNRKLLLETGNATGKTLLLSILWREVKR